MASCLILENFIPNEIIPIGTMIVIVPNGSGAVGRAYDPNVDNLNDVIGVSYGMQNTSGRAFNLGDGPVFYTSPNDMFIWNEDLTFQLDENNQPLSDPNYVGFSPWIPSQYTAVIYKGFAAVLNTYASVPTTWTLLKSGASYNWYLVR